METPKSLDCDAVSTAGSIKSHKSSASKVSRTSRMSGTSKGSKKDGKRLGAAEEMVPAEEPKQPFDLDLVADGLTQLGKTADGLKPAYLTVTVTGTDLATTDPLIAYPHLQIVNLSDNRLTDIQSLGSLHSLTSIDVSKNKLTQVLDLKLPPSNANNIRYACFSSNAIQMLRDLSPFTRLSQLSLDSNKLERITGLSSCTLLKSLSLDSNKLVSCAGLEALSGLRELSINHNVIPSLEPLAGLNSLQVLSASHNRLVDLRAIHGMHALRILDVSHNAIARLEEVAAARDASLLDTLGLAGNPVMSVMAVRLHLVYLLPQVVMLNGSPVATKEKVLAANMHGADADGLRRIRRRFFPNGELDDGGGAIPPMAAGLIASAAEEEQAEGTDNIDKGFVRMDAVAASLKPEAFVPQLPLLVPMRGGSPMPLMPPSDRLPAGAAAGHSPLPGSASPPLGKGEHTTAGNGSSSAGAGPAEGSGGAASRTSSSPIPGVAAEEAASAPAGVHLLALADQLRRAAGGSQLSALRACHEWMVSHTAPPRDPRDLCLVDAPLFYNGSSTSAATSRQQAGTPGAGGDASGVSSSVLTGGVAAELLRSALHTEAALLGGVAGMWSERCVWLFMQLCRACGLEAVTVWGYWKSGELDPGQEVYAHNHCWAAVKVNGKWRLLDPARAALLGGNVAFFVPPDAFIYSYWPLEAAWQLLPEPLSLETWWSLPNASVEFFALGGQLMDPCLAAVNELRAPREGALQPCIMVPVALPCMGQASSGTLPPTNSSSSGGGSGTGGSGGIGVLSHRLLDACSREVLASWPPARVALPGGEVVEKGIYEQPGTGLLAQCFQQLVAGAQGKVDVTFGAHVFGSTVQQLWTSLPGPGEYIFELVHVREVPNFSLRIEGLTRLLQLRVTEDVHLLRAKFVVPSIAHHDPDEDGVLHSPALRPRPLPVAHPLFAALGAQLVSPPPQSPLEADRVEPFTVVVPEVGQVALVVDEAGNKHFLDLLHVEVESESLAAEGGVARPSSGQGKFSCSRPSSSTTAAVAGAAAGGIGSGLAGAQAGQRSGGAVSGRGGGVNHGHGISRMSGGGAGTPPRVFTPPQHITTSTATSPAIASTPAGTFSAPVTIPRARTAMLMALVHSPLLMACAWQPLLTMSVSPQGQHIVSLPSALDEAEYDEEDGEVRSAMDMFRAMDRDADGKVTRKDMLCAFKRNRQTADILKFPHIVRQWDGTWERFLDQFLSVDSERLGAFTFNDLAAYMGIRPANEYNSSEDGDEESEEEMEDAEA